MRDTRSSAEKMFSIHVYDLKRDMKETNNQYVIQVTPKDAALRRPDIITRLRHVYSLTQEARSGEVEAFVVNARLLSSQTFGEVNGWSTALLLKSTASAPPGNLSEMQTLGPHVSLTESEVLGVGISSSCFNKSSRGSPGFIQLRNVFF